MPTEVWEAIKAAMVPAREAMVGLGAEREHGAVKAAQEVQTEVPESRRQEPGALDRAALPAVRLPTDSMLGAEEVFLMVPAIRTMVVPVVEEQEVTLLCRLLRGMGASIPAVAAAATL
jgi:hypothetical protein